MFKVFGSGKKGGKAEDLEKYADIISSSGMKTLDSLIILSDVFLEVMKALGLNETSVSEEFDDAKCPDCLRKINEEILNEMKVRVPYAIRSSALSERGGTGIYKSTFFVKTGNQENDLEELWNKEKEVYASEFTTDAKLWRKRVSGSIGMAILIQEVFGIEVEGCLLPALAGTAYTSYQGLLTIRVVKGLGTRAVKGEGMIYNLPPDDVAIFYRELWEQDRADAIDLITGETEEIYADYEEIYGAISYKAFTGFFEKLAKIKQHGDFSLEWVIADKKSDIVVVQCSPYEDRLAGDMSIDKDRYFLLAAGIDVLHSGRANCRGLVYVHHWDQNAAAILESLNDKMKDYLLIVPQEALSTLADIPTRYEGVYSEVTGLKFRHFSNASAVVEEQRHLTEEHREGLRLIGEHAVDHTGGRGGATHFEQLCTRINILFLGAEFDTTPLLILPGRMEYPEGITAWDTESVMLTDGQAKQGFVYIAKDAKDNRYSPSQLVDWSMALRQVADDLSEDDIKTELANSFYCAHYSIGDEDSPVVDFDPFWIDPVVLREYGISEIIKSLGDVTMHLDLMGEMSDEEKEDFKQYLNEFVEHLKKQEAQKTG